MIELHPELARAIVEGMPVAIAVLNADGCVHWGNAELATLLKRDINDIVGRTPNSLKLPAPKRESSEPSTSGSQIIEKGRLIGISQESNNQTVPGRILIVIEKKQAIDWFLDVLSTGSFNSSITSRLLSRNALLNRLQVEVSRSRRYANPLSCLVVRIDFGGGDENVLRREVHTLIASTLTELLRWVDVLGQWSERALIVILPETKEDAANQLAEKVSLAINENLGGSTAGVGINVGASTWRKGDDAARLVRRAEIVARRQIGSTTRALSY